MRLAWLHVSPPLTLKWRTSAALPGGRAHDTQRCDERPPHALAIMTTTTPTNTHEIRIPVLGDRVTLRNTGPRKQFSPRGSRFATFTAGIRRSRFDMGEGRSGSFDTSFIAVGGVLSGALALGTAVLFRVWLSTDGGPTAATLSEAFSLLYGAATGLAVGSALVALAARTGPRTLTGAVAGLVGYGVILTPVLIVTAPSDVSVAESIEFVAFAAILVAPAILLGAAVGARMAGYRNRGIYRRSRR